MADIRQQTTLKTLTSISTGMTSIPFGVTSYKSSKNKDEMFIRKTYHSHLNLSQITA